MIIYRIFNETHNYIGSTKLSLKERMRTHKTFKKNKRQCSSKIIIESGNYQVEILEECDDNNRYIREQYWIEHFVCVNISNAIRIKKNEWSKRNPEKNKEWKRLYYLYQTSWGGDKRRNNNLLQIDPCLFN